MAEKARKLEELVEVGDPVGSRPLQQGMQQVTRCQDVGESSVAGPMAQSELARKGGELAVGHLLAHQVSSHGEGVHRRVGDGVPSGLMQSTVEARQIESDVVTDDDRRPHELEERGKDLADVGGGGN